MAITSQAPGVFVSVQDLTNFVDAVPSTWAYLPIICQKGPDNVVTRVSRSELLEKFGVPDINYTNNANFGMGPLVAERFLSQSDDLWVVRVLPLDLSGESTPNQNATFGHLAIKMIGIDQTGENSSVWHAWNDSTTGTEDPDSSNAFKAYFYPYWYGPDSYDNSVALDKYLDIQENTRTLDHTSWYDELQDTTAINDTLDPTILIFYGVGRGAYYNNFQIDVNPHPEAGQASEGIYILDLYKKQLFSQRFTTAGDANTFRTMVDYEIVESFQISFDPDKRDSAGNSIFVEEVINSFSSEVRCEANKDLLKELARRSALAAGHEDDVELKFETGFKQTTNAFNPYDAYDDSGQPTDEFLAFLEGLDADNTGAYAHLTYLTSGVPFKNGDDGCLFTLRDLGNGNRAFMIDTDVATQLLSQAYTGNLKSPWTPIDEDDENNDPTTFVDQILDTENYLFDVVLDAGYPQNVKDSIVNLANTRQDLVAFVDNADSKTAAQALLARTPGNVSTTRNTSAYNTEYVSLYEPYSKVYDPFSGKDLWVPPTYHVGPIVGFSDRNYEVWTPLAGFRRASINTVKGLRYNPTLSDRDKFTRQQLNPIARFSNGYALFGQRTTLRRASALQDLNVVRLVNYIKRSLARFCRSFIFELNNEETWSAINEAITMFLGDIKSRGGLENFTVDVGATEYDKRLRRINANISLKPVRAVEQIYLQFFVEQ